MKNLFKYDLRNNYPILFVIIGFASIDLIIFGSGGAGKMPFVGILAMSLAPGFPATLLILNNLAFRPVFVGEDGVGLILFGGSRRTISWGDIKEIEKYSYRSRGTGRLTIQVTIKSHKNIVFSNYIYGYSELVAKIEEMANRFSIPVVDIAD